MKWLLWLSTVAIFGLTFVWPFTVSRDPDQPSFRYAAISVLLLFLFSLLALLTKKVLRRG